MDYLKKKVLEKIRRNSSSSSLDNDYIEYLADWILKTAEELWKKNIKGKQDWLYHRTSILFLPHIQKYGLDSKKLPRGLKRGIEKISKIFEKHGFSAESNESPFMDVITDVSERGIYLARDKEIVKPNPRISKTPIKFPFFLYSLFNEQHIKSYLEKNSQLRKMFDSLSEEDKKMCEIIWRFGRILRKKDKTVLLHISLDSEFLKYLGLPDFINNFQEYFLEHVLSGLNLSFESENLRDFDKLKRILTLHFQNIQTVFILLHGNWLSPTEIRKPIPPKFIYLEVKKPVIGYKLINITDWNMEMNPRVYPS